jgi:hypothetical protein
MKRIKLTQGKYALVDDEDFEWLNQWKWHAFKRPHTFYASRNICSSDGKRGLLLMHRLLTEAPKGREVDHKDGNGLNNQRVNLRVCTDQENRQNRCKPSHNKSGYKGVSWHKRSKKWHAQIGANGIKMKSLGYFTNKIEAAKAYDSAARKYHGEYARLNLNTTNL